MLRNIVIKNRYVDSVLLMSIAAKAKQCGGVTEVSAMMGTDANKDLLRATGLLDPRGVEAGPMDLIIAVVADDDSTIKNAAEEVGRLLTTRSEETAGPEETLPRTLTRALEQNPKSNLLFISLPGAYVRREADAALDRGLHVMIFSDNVSLDDEIALKRKARERGLLVMGPDCGTAIISGIALGFANVVNRGPVGIVAASGTGIQEVSCLLSNRGHGITHAIGLGGRDLKEEVGGISMLQGIEGLDADPDTKLIVLISKPPAPSVARTVLDRAKECSKPVIVIFLKGDPAEAAKRGLAFSPNLEGGALAAVAVLEGKKYTPTEISPELSSRAREAGKALKPGPKYIRGLYSGGTLCDESLLILRDLVGDCYSNIPLKPELKLKDSKTSTGNCLVDLGDDEFTKGRPHPMIDFTLRCERIVQEARDPGTAVILLDVVLGHGAHPDPAAELVPSIDKAREIAQAAGRSLWFVASITGTDGDPQNRSVQKSRLECAGVLVAGSNAEAARAAAMIVSGKGR
ncbi:MAG: acyl-CoA synthetase FdrA [Candidatus Aureabacteria bacterium]|nr:acyl-CoA synthetase FdrA [Candidatus Auribacterota bacterium]